MTRNPALMWDNPETGKPEPMGCYCMMMLKAWFAIARCWLHEQGLTDEGWPVELDGV